MRIGDGATSGAGAVGAIRPKADAVHMDPRFRTDGLETNDVFSVSSIAQLAAAARDKINEMPAIRAGSVESVQNQLGADVHRADSVAVADGLLREYLQRGSHISQ
ncbi:MAG: hypothetical protein FWG12_01375 [Holophagaceae bacterium]|nr:hypothetical protein [Holophagaceae bacterium]